MENNAAYIVILPFYLNSSILLPNLSRESHAKSRSDSTFAR